MKSGLKSSKLVLAPSRMADKLIGCSRPTQHVGGWVSDRVGANGRQGCRTDTYLKLASNQDDSEGPEHKRQHALEHHLRSAARSCQTFAATPRTLATREAHLTSKPTGAASPGERSIGLSAGDKVWLAPPHGRNENDVPKQDQQCIPTLVAAFSRIPTAAKITARPTVSVAVSGVADISSSLSCLYTLGREAGREQPLVAHGL
jgi:hypothetical protein